MTGATGERRALLLDLDGTIADTLPHIFESFRHAVGPWVDRPPTDAEVEATFGPTERGCVARMVPPAHLDEADARFNAFYEAGHRAEVGLCEGIDEVIDHARRLGWGVGVFTGKGRRTSRFTLEALGLADRIECLVTGDDVTCPKPHPEGLYLASRLLGVPTGRMLLAGDSPGDIQAGRAAGTRTAAALWASHRPERLRDVGADFTCERVADLIRAVDQLHKQPA